MVPVLSEFDSFPVDPNLDAVENCVAGVKNKADIFVLVVGGRYGSQVEGGKSITNIEYLEAKAKGIPCYVFVQKPLLAALPIWRKNSSGDFSDVVDSPLLFEFVESLRDPKENWIFPFESAQDIIETLRKQLAYLFMDALSLRGKVIRSGLPEALRDLSGAALLLLIQKPFAWEQRLFGQIFCDELHRMTNLRRDFDYGLMLGHIIQLHDINEVLDWIRKKSREIIAYVKSAEQLINVVLPKAFRPSGEPADAEEIVYVARRMASVYRSILDWSGDFKHIQADEAFDRILEITSRISSNVISEIEGFASTIQKQLTEVTGQDESMKQAASPQTITLTLTCPDISDMNDELCKLAKLYGFKYGKNGLDPNVA
jgi:hypothetical protein